MDLSELHLSRSVLPLLSSTQPNIQVERRARKQRLNNGHISRLDMMRDGAYALSSSFSFLCIISQYEPNVMWLTRKVLRQEKRKEKKLTSP